MKTWLPVISSGLAVFFCVLWLSGSCDKPSTKPEDSVLWRQRTESLTRVINDKDSIIAAITKRSADRQAKDSTALIGHQIENSAMSRQLAQARHDIQPIIDTSAIVRRYVELSDSTIARRDSTINFMGMSMRAQQFDHKEAIRAMGEKNVTQQQISSLLETKVMDLENQNSKLAKKLARKKNWNTFWKGLAGGTAAALAITIISNQ